MVYRLGRFLTILLLTVVAVSLVYWFSASGIGYSSSIEAFNLSSSRTSIVEASAYGGAGQTGVPRNFLFLYKFVVYGWRGSAVTVDFWNPLNKTGSVILYINGVKAADSLALPKREVSLGTFKFSGDGVVSFELKAVYSNLTVYDLASMGGPKVYTSGRPSFRFFIYFSFIQVLAMIMVILLVWATGRYWGVIEVLGGWMTVMLLWVILPYKLGIHGPLIYDLSMKYPFNLVFIADTTLSMSNIVKVLGVIGGVLGFYYSKSTGTCFFEYLYRVFNPRLILGKLTVVPLMSVISIVSLFTGVVFSIGGLAMSKYYSFYEFYSIPVFTALYVSSVFIASYIFSGGVTYATERPMASLTAALLIVLFTQFDWPFQIGSNTGVTRSGYLEKYVLKVTVFIAVGIVLVLLKWLKR